ncbi:hypothetical protein Cfor_12524 [Coptotermes formosanus]|uniref:CUB domain-containing protein n=1 Tax=Coptotermes formosanus TaxID=36987 RepID=A0A6L2P7R8_COPFO|nr:hypothetical protein Cfor_12524 [Coptotermes formosanus]
MSIGICADVRLNKIERSLTMHVVPTVTATCGTDIANNITYFVSPLFPALSRDAAVCSVKIQKVDPSVSQLRLDFIHFNLGQPNRRTGVCDSDVFIMSGPATEQLKLCGQNSGQHVYYDVENVKDPVSIVMNLTDNNLFRMWEIKITQIEFSERAPAGCRQYYQGNSGIIQTMNFAVNGRHLADQDYTICMRQEEGMCSIAYEPCDENSFKIGPPVLSGENGVSMLKLRCRYFVLVTKMNGAPTQMLGQEMVQWETAETVMTRL